MKKTNTFFPLLLSLIALCMFLITIKEPHNYYYFYTTTYDVRVVNGFSDNSSLPLVIWCASPEADMGGRALQEGDDYGWSHTANFWGSNDRVFCTVKWDQKRKKFDAFHVSRDSQRCSPMKMCLWLVKKDGFYFSNDGLAFHKDFSWG